MNMYYEGFLLRQTVEIRNVEGKKQPVIKVSVFTPKPEELIFTGYFYNSLMSYMGMCRSVVDNYIDANAQPQLNQPRQLEFNL